MFLDKKTEHFKDANSFQINVLNISSPIQNPERFYLENEKKKIMRGNCFYSTSLTTNFQSGLLCVCVCVCVCAFILL